MAPAYVDGGRLGRDQVHHPGQPGLRGLGIGMVKSGFPWMWAGWASIAIGGTSCLTVATLRSMSIERILTIVVLGLGAIALIIWIVANV